MFIESFFFSDFDQFIPEEINQGDYNKQAQ